MARVTEVEEPTVVREREVVRDEPPRRSPVGTILLILLILFVVFLLLSWRPWGNGGSDSTNINVPTPTTNSSGQ